MVSRQVLPVCGTLCFFCPALSTRSRQPIKRYKKLLRDIFPRSPVLSPSLNKLHFSFLMFLGWFLCSPPILCLYYCFCAWKNYMFASQNPVLILNLRIMFSQGDEPNERMIGKLCEYASKNPFRVPKVPLTWTLFSLISWFPVLRLFLFIIQKFVILCLMYLEAKIMCSNCYVDWTAIDKEVMESFNMEGGAELCWY